MAMSLGSKLNGDSPSPRDLRWFGCSLFIGFSILGLLVWIRTGGGDSAGRSEATVWTLVPYVFWTAGVLGAILPWVSLPAARGLFRTWTAMASSVARVMIPVGLTVLFLLLLPWFSLIRVSDPLRKRLGGAKSYWEPHRNAEPTLERMMRPF